METAHALIETDQQHVIHSLHYAKETERPFFVIEGQGEMLRDAVV
jgi:mannose-6-phosphate isomerase-like protein (cupin superfamily)